MSEVYFACTYKHLYKCKCEVVFVKSNRNSMSRKYYSFQFYKNQLRRPAPTKQKQKIVQCGKSAPTILSFLPIYKRPVYSLKYKITGYSYSPRIWCTFAFYLLTERILNIVKC